MLYNPINVQLSSVLLLDGMGLCPEHSFGGPPAFFWQVN